MPDDKKAELDAAVKAVETATTAVETAKADLKTAEDSKDDAKITEAKGKVTAAESTLQTAEAAKMALDDDEDDADDLIDDATGDKQRLKDGTDPNKDIRISKEKFDDLNEQAKLLKQFAPVLAKLQKDPKLVEKLMAGDDPNQSVQERLQALEERDRAEKKTEVTKVINAALKAWPDFRSKWGDVKPLIAGLEASGISYAEAVERAYFAVNPEAAKEGKRIADQVIARDRENRRGQMPPAGGGGGNRIHADAGDDGFQLTDADNEFARLTGLDPKLYAKHAEHIRRFADL